jgi:hypothetical protein
MNHSISISLAIAMHLVWSVGLVLDGRAINATGLHTMLSITHDPGYAALLFGVVALMALCSMFVRRSWLTVALLLPQQAALWVSVVGAINAMAIGQFADGISRGHWFLVVDQIPVVLITLGHTAALLLIAEKRPDG